ncbi:MAG: hypothetical protein R2751_10045 [Bacteroidales bacterium]
MKHPALKASCVASFFLTALLTCLFPSCKTIRPDAGELPVTAFVDPFIGTDFHGHTFPGACLPFGMVQLSPDTRTMGWDGCSGYHASDSTILGFSHTHLSGTGIGDYGDVLFLPYSGEAQLEPGEEDRPDSGYRSRFDKTSETAKPGFYAVHLTDDDIAVELTATQRAGFHRYVFGKAGRSGVLVDLVHTIHGGGQPLHEIVVINDREIQGLKYSSGWARNQYVYFTAQFSKPFEISIFQNDSLVAQGPPSPDPKIPGTQTPGTETPDSETPGALVRGTRLKALLEFDTEPGEVLLVKVGLSATGYDGSRNNLASEIPGWDFEAVKMQAQRTWENQLNRV